MEGEELNLYELLKDIWEGRKLIALVVLTTTTTALVVSFLIKPVYRTEAVLMPVSSEKISPYAQLASEFLGISISQENTSAKVMTVLKSRTLRERVVEKLALSEDLLDEKYKGNRIVAASKVLEKLIEVKTDKKTGAITLSVEYYEPKKAKRIAEEIIRQLQKILEEKALTISKANRVFLEKQLVKTERELKAYMTSLAELQKREKVLVPQEQVKGSLELYAELLSQKITLEVKLRELERVLSPTNPRLRALKDQINAIQRQIHSIENASGLSVLPSFESAPEKMKKFSGIFMKVEGLKAKYSTLLKLYEQAKMEEQRERIYVEVIDPPYTPEEPAKPQRKKIVAGAFTVSLFLGIMVVLFYNWLMSQGFKKSDPDEKPDGGKG